MNESKSNVAALNHTPGFEQMKILRKIKSRKSREAVPKLELRYKKWWFKLVHPKGQVRVRRLKLTEQIAVYEAQVYLDRSDTEPISNFTASCIYNNAIKNNYIKEAQEQAIDGALASLGFDLQFIDSETTKEVPTVSSAAPVQQKPQPSVRRAEDKLPVQPAEKNELPIAPVEKAVKEETKLPVEPVEQSKQQLSQPSHTNETPGNLTATQRAMQILQGRGNIAKSAPATQPAAAVIPEEGKETVSPKYTKNTPVPEILKLMTLEEAQNVVVDVGTCAGKTIKKVADTRPAVLKYYQFGGYKGGNNILIAAATIMYNHLESQRLEKAG